jgi:MoaA/NifB/PqqE/SkfB family radical SAM enzyme
MIKPDMKSLLRLSSSGVLGFLRMSSRMIALPTLVIYPTSACNYDCVMCASRRSNLTPRAFMTLPMMESLLEQCAQMVIRPRLHFSGMGEPLIYPQMSQVMAMCRERGLKWSVTTNGLALKKYAAEIVTNKASGINLSVHGTSAEHVRITNTEGSWERITEALHILAEEKRKQDKERPLVALNCVITNENVLSLHSILQAYAALPVNSVTFQHLIFSKAELDAGAKHLIVDADKLNALSEFTDYVRGGSLPIKCNIFPRIRSEDIIGYYTEKDYPFAQSCVLPWLTVRVYPNGDVGMCDQILGSLLTESLGAILNGEPAREYRNRVRTGTFRQQICFRCCHRQYYGAIHLNL